MVDGSCPYCGSENVEANEGFGYETGSINTLTDSQKCNNCGKKFFGIYKFIGYEDTDGKTIPIKR